MLFLGLPIFVSLAWSKTTKALILFVNATTSISNGMEVPFQSELHLKCNRASIPSKSFEMRPPFTNINNPSSTLHQPSKLRPPSTSSPDKSNTRSSISCTPHRPQPSPLSISSQERTNILRKSSTALFSYKARGGEIGGLGS